MFENVAPLLPERHKNLRYTPSRKFSFAKNLQTAPIAFSEVAEASRYFPIIFGSEENPFPNVLLSLKEGTNPYVDGEGNWKAPYVPAHIRRYPFILHAASSENTFVVSIDESAEHFSESEGEALFDDNNQPTEVTENAKNFLQIFQRDMEATKEMMNVLSQVDILGVRNIETRSGEESEIIASCLIVEQEKIDALANEEFLRLRESKLLPILYAALFSETNVRNLSPIAQ